MTNVAIRDFNTTQRRFAIGTPVSILDDLAPHTFGDLKERGFIGTKADAAEAIAEKIEAAEDVALEAAAPAEPEPKPKRRKT